MQQVNLLIEELRPKREVLGLRQLVLAWAAFGGLLAVISAWQGFELWQLSAEQKEKADQVVALQRANAQLKASVAVEPDPVLQAEVEDMRHRQTSQQLLVGAVTDYEAASDGGFSPYLTDLARHHVKGMWLNRISFTNGGSRIRLTGQAVDPVHVPVFLQQLSRVGSFKGHRVDAFELQELEAGLLRFEITGPKEARSG
jgi:hypothetical protein